jgi:hypothetical protein
MREMDFSEKNVVNRWMGVNSIWSAIQGANCLTINVTEG